MPSFAYRAADPHGRIVSGELECESEAELLRALEQRALTAVQTRRSAAQRRPVDSGTEPTRIRLPLVQQLQFTRQLKVLLASGITLLAALALLRKQARGAYHTFLNRVATDIQRGGTLSDALAQHPRTFDAFYIGVVRAGETAGQQAETLAELVAHYERHAALRRDLLAALTYPAIVMLVLIGAAAIMLTCVVPQFEAIFAASRASLPLPTRLLLGISRFVTGYPATLAAAVAGLAAGLWLVLAQPAVRATLGRFATRLPLFGRLLYLHTIVQFCRMTALLERSGVPILETLRVVEAMLIPGRVRTLIGDVRRQVVAGNSLSGSIEGTAALPDLVEQMIAVGENTGKIDETLLAAAAHYEDETRVQIKRLTVALEPLLTLLVSALVLGMALAIFLPMWEMHSLLLKK